MSVTQDWVEEHGDDHTLIGVLVEGPTDRAGVFADLLANLPASYDLFSLQKVESVTLIPGMTDLWTARIKYGAYREKKELQSGESEFRYRTGLKSFRRTISRASAVYDSTGLMDPQPPDARIIGWKPESRQAMGVEDTERVYSFGWTIITPFDTATASWRKQIGELIGTINDDSFFGYDAEEVKFEEISDTVRADGEYRFDLSFTRQPTLTDLDVGGIVIPSVKGWDIVDTPLVKFVEVDGVILPQVERVKIHKGPLAASWSLLATLLDL